MVFLGSGITDIGRVSIFGENSGYFESYVRGRISLFPFTNLNDQDCFCFQIILNLLEGTLSKSKFDFCRF